MKKKAPEEARKLVAIKSYINRERSFPGCISGRAGADIVMLLIHDPVFNQMYRLS